MVDPEGRGLPLNMRHVARANSVDPRTISTLTAWWDMSDATSLFTDAGITAVTADGDKIYQANDKSGNSKHMVQTTLGLRPLHKRAIRNGLHVARFDGVDDYLTQTFTADASYTVFLVAVKNSAVDGNFCTLWSIHDGSQLICTTAWDATRYNWYANEAVGHPPIPGLTPVVWRVIALRITSGAVMDIYADGGSPALNLDPAPGVTTGTIMALGAAGGTVLGNNPINADIGECLVYDSALSSANLNAVGAYLSAKWATTWTAVP